MRLVCLLSCLLMMGVGASQAHATTVFDWTYNSPTGGGTGSGSLTTDTSGLITEIDGTFDGTAITGILPYDANLQNDNKLFYPATPLLDYGGVLFQLADGSRVNLYYFIYIGQPDSYQDERMFTSGAVEAGYGPFTVTPQVAATPLPGTLPLFVSGLGMIGLLGRRRRRAD